MPSILNPYIQFKDNARAALEFYQSVFGGELAVNTFGDFGMTEAPDPDLLMHGRLNSDAGYTIMASDTGPGMEYQGGSSISVSLSGDDGDALRDYWTKLSEGGRVDVPLAKQAWGDEFGMCADKFGIVWMVNVEGSAPA